MEMCRGGNLNNLARAGSRKPRGAPVTRAISLAMVVPPMVGMTWFIKDLVASNHDFGGPWNALLIEMEPMVQGIPEMMWNTYRKPLVHISNS